MAIRHIREAFNQEAGDHAQCQRAFLRYEDNGAGGQHQVITIEGVKADGSTFKLSTPAHAMADDPHHHVRALARDMKEEPAAAEPMAAAGPTPSTEAKLFEPRPEVSRQSAGGSPASDNLPNPFSPN